jgi:Na+/pantothenate symporter
MRKDKAALRNGIILGTTIVALIVITVLLARTFVGDAT